MLLVDRSLDAMFPHAHVDAHWIMTQHTTTINSTKQAPRPHTRSSTTLHYSPPGGQCITLRSTRVAQRRACPDCGSHLGSWPSLCLGAPTVSSTCAPPRGRLVTCVSLGHTRPIDAPGTCTLPRSTGHTAPGVVNDPVYPAGGQSRPTPVADSI